MTNSNNKPIDTLRDGSLKATIWPNATDEGGVRYSIALVRSYKDKNDEWQDTAQFSSGELLRVAHLANRAYERVRQLREEAKSSE